MLHGHSRYRPARILLCTVFLCGLAACAGEPALRPAAEARMVPDDGMAAAASVAGVTVIAEAGAWRGSVDIDEVVVPLKVRVENNSDRKLRIRYSDFGLVSESGRSYAALPPYEVRGSVLEPVMAAGYSPIRYPGFTHTGFHIAAHYGGVYTTLPPYTVHDLYYDPFYYSSYYPYWRRVRARVDLPTADMLRMAIPEGVLDEGGEVQGFLYFEKIPSRLTGTRINFHFDLIDAVSGERFATAHIPFVADNP